MKKIASVFAFFILCFSIMGCSQKSENTMNVPVKISIKQDTIIESESQTTTEDINSIDDLEIQIPSKEEVLAMRELVLEGMTNEDIERLTENMKVANLRLESAYLNDNVFEKLSDKDSLYWNYFDQKGDIQVGWSYDGDSSDIRRIMVYWKCINNFI